jgi:hypothetical protein
MELTYLVCATGLRDSQKPRSWVLFFCPLRHFVLERVWLEEINHSILAT